MNMDYYEIYCMLEKGTRRALALLEKQDPETAAEVLRRSLLFTDIFLDKAMTREMEQIEKNIDLEGLLDAHMPETKTPTDE